MTTEAVLATEAGTYMGSAAVEAGLADKVGTLEQARADMAEALSAAATTDHIMTFAASCARRAANGFTTRSA